MTRINLFLLDGTLSRDALADQIVCADALRSKNKGGYSLIVGNPPWGFDYSKPMLASLAERYESAKKTGAESFDLFIERGLSLLSDGGTLGYVVPEAVLNVSSHEPCRSVIIEKSSFSFVSYLGNVFSDVQCPAVILGLVKNPGGNTAGCRVIKGGTKFTIGEDRPVSSAGFTFDTDADRKALDRIESAPGAKYLKDHAKFALGIVTGNNKEFLSGEKRDGAEPILRGTDVMRFRAGEPESYIRFEPDRFQQCAPEDVYRSREKLVYRFICDVPVFAYDAGGTLSLNSCNVLIPQIRGLGIKYVLAVLNSSAAAFFFEKKYGSVKMLRSHIEALPIPCADDEVREKVESLVDEMISGGSRETYRELDRIISDLYCLSGDEKETVERFASEKPDFLPG